jgi:predicted protein tyrosine phosphatase
VCGYSGDPYLDQMSATKILFVCGKEPPSNVLRGRNYFAGMDGIEVRSGASSESACPMSGDLLDWADWVFVMENSQKRHLRVRFVHILKDKRVLCLNIPDDYEYMQPS